MGKKHEGCTPKLGVCPQCKGRDFSVVYGYEIIDGALSYDLFCSGCGKFYLTLWDEEPPERDASEVKPEE